MPPERRRSLLPLPEPRLGFTLSAGRNTVSKTIDPAPGIPDSGRRAGWADALATAVEDLAEEDLVWLEAPLMAEEELDAL
jgi:hypothetical protein